MKSVILLVIFLYRYSGLRLLVRALGDSPVCRFYPNCSEYIYGAIKKHGLIHGSLLGMRRIARCQPFVKGGIDMVPQVF